MHLAIASSLGVIFFTSLSSMRSHFFLGNVDKSILKKMIFGNFPDNSMDTIPILKIIQFIEKQIKKIIFCN